MAARSRFAAKANKRQRRAQLLARAPRSSPTIERQYTAAVRRLMSAFHDQIRAAALPSYRHDASVPAGKVALSRTAFESLSAKAKAASDAFRATAFTVAKRLEKFSKSEAVRTLGDLARDLPTEVAGFAERFAADAAAKLTALMDGTLEALSEELGTAELAGAAEVGVSLLDGLLAGWLARTIGSATNAITQSSAELNRERQQDAGVASYVWLSMRDRFVRSPHAELDGGEFAWGEFPLTALESSSGAPCEPGDDYNCRCLASPVISMTAEPASEGEIEAESGGEEMAA